MPLVPRSAVPLIILVNATQFSCTREFIELSDAVCGNGVLEGAETCDDGNPNLADACPSGPGGSCRIAACGDGFVQDGVEACDDGNTSRFDGCDDFCMVEANYVCQGSPSACECAPTFQDNDSDGRCNGTCEMVFGTGLECDGVGTCSDASGQAVCTCDPGFQDNDSNNSCLPTCATSPGGANCGGLGTCDDSGGRPACTCNTGFQDNDENGTCETNCENSPGGSTCGGLGLCSDASGSVVCTCVPGHHDDGAGTCIPDTCDFLDCPALGRMCDESGPFVVCGPCPPGTQEAAPGGVCLSQTCVELDCVSENRLCDETGPNPVCGDCASGFHDGGDGATCVPVGQCIMDPGIFLSDSGDCLARGSACDSGPIAAGPLTITGANLASLLGCQQVSPGGLTLTNIVDTDLSSLEQLISVAGGFSITTSANLTSLAGLGRLQTVGGALSIADNPLLVSMGDISALASTGGLAVERNVELDTVSLTVQSINGDVTFSGNDDLVSVTSTTLQTVTGELRVLSNDVLSDVSFPNLSVLTNGLEVDDNIVMSILDLSMVGSTSGNISITSNPDLGSVQLDDLATVTGTITLADVTSMTSFNLEMLTSVGGSLVITDISATSTNIASAVETVGQDLILARNSGVRGVYASLQSVGGNITLEDNSGLDTQMWGSFSIGDDLTVTGNTSTTSLVLPSISGVDDVVVSDNPGLSDLVLGVVDVRRSLEIDRNMTLSAINLVSLGGTDVMLTFSIDANPALTDVTATGLSTIGGAFAITNNTVLPVCDAVDIRSSLWTSGGLGASSSVAGNRAPCAGVSCGAMQRCIPMPCGFSPETFCGNETTGDLVVSQQSDVPATADSIDGNVTVAAGYSETALDFSTLRYITGNLTITSVTMLSSLGLSDLIVEGNVVIDNNAALTSISGGTVAPFISVGGTFSITNNNLLDNCSAQSIADTAQCHFGVGGAVTVSGNQPGICP